MFCIVTWRTSPVKNDSACCSEEGDVNAGAEAGAGAGIGAGGGAAGVGAEAGDATAAGGVDAELVTATGVAAGPAAEAEKFGLSLDTIRTRKSFSLISHDAMVLSSERTLPE